MKQKELGDGLGVFRLMQPSCIRFVEELEANSAREVVKFR